MPRISNHGGLWKHCLKALVLLTNVGKTTAISQLLPINGISGELTGYPGLAYHAIRYEPLCGNLGSGARYSNPIDMTDRCKPAMESFGNNTNDNVALYDITGSRLPDGRVGGGYDVCLCFALSQIDGGIKGALCLWVDGAGRADVWWSLHLDDILAGNFRPNVDKALPLCKDVNVASLKAQWSSTAAQPSFSEKTASAPGGSGRTRVEVSTFIPSVVEYAQVLTIKTTDADGSPTTQIVTRTTQAAVVTVADESKGLDRGDKIAIGVGLGVGIPTIILMLVGLCLQWYRRRR